MHLALFTVARKFIEETDPDNHVVGGFISPSHDSYVRGKLEIVMQAPHIPATHRLAMCDLGVRQSDWIDVSSWEANYADFVDFGVVADVHQRYLDRVCGNTDCFGDVFLDDEKKPLRLNLLFLCGADLALGLTTGIYGRIGVAAVARPGHTTELRKIIKRQDQNPENKRPMFFFIETETEDISSSKIRKCMYEGNIFQIASMCGEPISRYLHEHGIIQIYEQWQREGRNQDPVDWSTLTPAKCLGKECVNYGSTENDGYCNSCHYKW